MEENIPESQPNQEGPRNSKNQIGSYKIEHDTLFAEGAEAPNQSFDSPDQSAIQGETGCREEEQKTQSVDNWQEIVGSKLK